MLSLPLSIGHAPSLSDLELYKTLKGSSRAGEPQDVILGLCLPHTELENLVGAACCTYCMLRTVNADHSCLKSGF